MLKNVSPLKVEFMMGLILTGKLHSKLMSCKWSKSELEYWTILVSISKDKQEYLTIHLMCPPHVNLVLEMDEEANWARKSMLSCKGRCKSET